MQIQHFHDSDTGTLTYVVWDPASRDCVVIDPVWNFESETQTVSETSVQQVLSYLATHSLKLHGILETHAHADHLSAAQVLKTHFPHAQLMIGESIRTVQSTFQATPADASQFDRTLKPNSDVQLGSLRLRTLPTPGHTPACMTYLFGDAAFTGDALFMPDGGTGRCDFPGGSAKELYHSIHSVLYSLPDTTRLFVGHDYCPNGRELKFQTTVGESKQTNVHLRADTTEAEFVSFREARDKTLKEPRLLKPSLTVNLAGGRLAPGMHRARESKA